MNIMEAGQALAQESAEYERLKPQLLAVGLAGKWIAILGHRQIAISDSAEEAHRKGIEAAGLDQPFLLKQIGEDDVRSMPNLWLVSAKETIGSLGNRVLGCGHEPG